VLQRIDHHAKAIHSARRAGQGIHHRKTVDRAGKTHGGYLDPGITELLGIGLASSRSTSYSLVTISAGAKRDNSALAVRNGWPVAPCAWRHRERSDSKTTALSRGQD